MKKTITKLLVALFFITSVSAKPFMWIASRVGDKIFTNHDVNKYSELLHITDQMKSKLFLEAQKDLNKYNELMAKAVELHFEESLRQLTYFTMVEKEATRGNKSEWKAFKVTLEEYMDEVRKIEDKVLEKYSEGRGIVHASTEFGKELIAKGYPHVEGTDARDLYYEWLKVQKKRIKEKFKIREVQRYESIMARKYNPSLRLHPLATHDFFVDNTAKINELLKDKRLTRREVEKILVENSQLSLLIKNIKYIAIDEASLADIRENSESMYQGIVAEINKRVIPSLTDERTAKVLHYEGIAKKLADKYQTVEKLEELSKEALGRFLRGNGNYNDFMLSRLYTIASIYVSSKPNREETRSLVENYSNKMVSIMKEKLSDDKWLSEKTESNSRIENKVGRLLTSLYENEVSKEESPYAREVLAMAVWTLKFEIKKLSTIFKPLIKVEIQERSNWEVIKKVQDFLKMEIYKEGVERFRNEDLRWWVGLFQVNPTGSANLFGDRAFSFLRE
ncbi:MAG: hypothetical protein GY909_13050 [Oligoflexia bacterium]|nr:hypothetical protein [Oligoflexia bacterium]